MLSACCPHLFAPSPASTARPAQWAKKERWRWRQCRSATVSTSRLKALRLSATPSLRSAAEGLDHCVRGRVDPADWRNRLAAKASSRSSRNSSISRKDNSQLPFFGATFLRRIFPCTPGRGAEDRNRVPRRQRVHEEGVTPSPSSTVSKPRWPRPFRSGQPSPARRRRRGCRRRQ